MRTPAQDVIPSRVRRSLAKLGGDIAIARRKRNLTAAMVAERVGVAKAAYLSRATYVTVSRQRVVIVRAFVKKTQKRPSMDLNSPGSGIRRSRDQA